MKGALTLWISICAAMLAGPAGGDQLLIEFDLRPSLVRIYDGAIEIPPNGGVSLGSLTLAVQASGPRRPLDGSAGITGASIGAFVNALGVTSVTGAFSGFQVGMRKATLAGASVELVGSGPLLRASASFRCTGPDCSSFPPVGLDGETVSSDLGPLTLAGLDTAGAIVSGPWTFLLGVSPVSVAVQGVEKERVFLRGEAVFSPNPEFDFDLAHWSFDPSGGSGSAEWARFDREDPFLSGSARLHNDSAQEDRRVRIVTDCFGVRPSAIHELRGFVYVPSAQGTDGAPGYRIRFFRREDCTESILWTSNTVSYVEDQWSAIDTYTVAPADAHAALLEVTLGKSGAGGEREALFDSVRLVPEPRAAACWLGTSVALAILARRRCRPRPAGSHHP